jgi:hypothetical protein
MRILAFLLLLLLAFPDAVCFADASQKVVRATRVATPPVIDGAVTEPQWREASPILDFTQAEPVQGTQPTEMTSVRILYDDRAIYVGVICYDTRPGAIARQLSRRDRATEADRFTVLLDSYFDRKSAFVFTTNVSGVQTDGILSQEGKVYDVSWDAVWDVRTRIYQDGWSAEFEIPYSALRFSVRPDSGYQWGINFRRYISRKKEIDEWVMVPRGDPYEISKWGTLMGITEIKPPLHLAFTPYVAGSTTFQTATQVQAASSATDVRAGLDIKYGVARNYTLDATINPDFGQVEVDQAVLNLTVFETLYPEKRPFFVEGSQQFFTFGSSYDKTPVSLFFSRRIGKAPSGLYSVSAPPGGTVAENPQQTTILSAAKLSGRSASGFSVGALTAVTDEEHAVVEDSLGSRASVQTEPRASYSVLRLRQEFEGGSWLGGMGTLAAHDRQSPSLSGGLDWNLRVFEGTHTLDGYLAAAHAGSGEGEQNGAAGRLLFSRIASEHWFYVGSYDFYTRHFNINDIGFFSRPHDQGGYGQVLYRQYAPEGSFYRYGLSFVPEMRWNWDGVLTMAQGTADAYGDFTNFWRLQVIVTEKRPAYDDAERGLIGTYLRPAAHSLSASVTTDERQSLVGSLLLGGELDAKDKVSGYSLLRLTWRPVSWVEMNPSLLYLVTRREETSVVAGGVVATVPVDGTPRSLFADRDLNEIDLSVRGTVTFTRTLSLQFFLQVLMARGAHTNYRALIGGEEFETAIGPVPDYDFNQGIFNANVLLRWEYMPGSSLFLVWTQSRNGDSGVYSTGFGDRFHEVFTLPHEDVLFLKVSYWLPL